MASKYGFDASSNFETLIVAREPYVKNNFIYDFFYDFNMIKFMIWIFSIFSLWKKYDEIYDEIYVFFSFWHFYDFFMIFLMIFLMFFYDFFMVEFMIFF